MAPERQAEWDPYSGFGHYAINFAVILTALMAALVLAEALKDAVRYLISRRCRAGSGSGSGSGERDRDSNASISDPEKPDVEEPSPLQPALAMVYSVASTKLAGAAAECTICLTEFADGDDLRVMPACRHGFHASCIERWLARGRRSSCPTCRAPAAVATAAAQPDEATNRRETYSGTGDNSRVVCFFVVATLQFIALALALLQAIVRFHYHK